MVKRTLAKKEVLLTVIPGPDGSPQVRYATVNGNRIQAIGEGVPSNSNLPMRVSVFSQDSYFEHADLPASSTKMLPLVARRHVDQELVFDGESYRLRAHSCVKRERTIAADIAAMPDSDIEAAVSLLPVQQKPCLQLVPLEFAIAALVDANTTEPAIVFWEKNGVLLSLLIVGGMVQTRMSERVSSENRGATIARAEASLRSSALHHGENREILLVLYTGELCDLVPANREKAALVLEKKIIQQYRFGKNAAKDSVLRTPEIYGLPFVAESWNFMEPDYCSRVRSWKYAKPAAALASAAGVVFALLGGIQHMQALAVAYKFEARRSELNNTLGDIEKIRPTDAQMKTVRDGLQLQLQSFNEVRLDQMLAWLTHLVPKGVVIRALEVEPSPPPTQRRGLVSVTYPAGQKPFIVKLEIVLADTAFDDAEASSAEIVRRLSQRLQMMDTRLDVPAPEPGVRRNIVLVVNAQARAEDF